MSSTSEKTRNGKLNGQQSVDSAVKSICDIMRRGNCAGAMQYVPELTWILFLRILDEMEEREAQDAEAIGRSFSPSLQEPYRWRDWAAPGSRFRQEVFDRGDMKDWVDKTLLPYLRDLENRQNATSRQKVISEVLSGVEKVRIDTQRNLLDVLDKVDALRNDTVDDTHVFTLSQVYEGLLLKMGEKNNDGGQFFTPRQIIRAMVRVVDPEIGQTVYDPACGTGGFLAQAYEHMHGKAKTGNEITQLKEHTFFGREKEDLIYPIALANLVLHGIDRPNLWHGNTLTSQESYGGLFLQAPTQYDTILMNPPFGGKEGKEAQTNFAYKTGATQVLFLQHVMSALKTGGRAGIVVDEGLLFRTNEEAFLRTKRKLLEENDVYCIISLPGGVFTAAGAGVKTNLVFFNKGKKSEKIWYYDLSHIKVGKKTPLTLSHFEEFFRLFAARTDSEDSWTVDISERMKDAEVEAAPLEKQADELLAKFAEAQKVAKEITRKKGKDSPESLAAVAATKAIKREASTIATRAADIKDAVFDLKAVNPNRKPVIDTRTPAELIALIREKGREIEDAMAAIERTL